MSTLSCAVGSFRTPTKTAAVVKLVIRKRSDVLNGQGGGLPPAPRLAIVPHARRLPDPAHPSPIGSSFQNDTRDRQIGAGGPGERSPSRPRSW
jgi:hypothetical protein